MARVPDIRIRAVNSAPARHDREWVIYWMVAFRRAHSNFALQRAAEWARDLDRPLLVFEPLRAGYPWANDRLHRFVIDGMCDNEEALQESDALYYPYVEPRPGQGSGLLAALAQRACVVVTDDFPAFFLPRMIEAAGRKLDVRLEAVDGNGLLPLQATRRVFTTAASFRIWLKKNLEPHLRNTPQRNPVASGLKPFRALPRDIVERWPRASRRLLDGDGASLAELEIDHSVPELGWRGGAVAAHARLRHFIRKILPNYAETRSAPELDGTSRLSPYLHFGHLGVHEVHAALARRDQKDPNVEAFFDELITWRELGFNMVSKREDASSYDSLPAWARQTLDAHRKDPRPKLQPRVALETATTPDPMFNAAQRQLLTEGWFHNVARMIWGKKILEYSKSPEEALKTMAHLMNRYSLDGRGPNSISGFFWVLGRYDRAWGPERPIFGKVRYMTSDTPEKLRRYRAYIAKYSGPTA